MQIQRNTQNDTYLHGKGNFQYKSAGHRSHRKGRMNLNKINKIIKFPF